MLLRVIDDGVFRDIEIKQGQMFLLPGAFTRFMHCISHSDSNHFPLDSTYTTRQYPSQSRSLCGHSRNCGRESATGNIYR